MGLLFLLLATGVIRTRQLEKSSQFFQQTYGPLFYTAYGWSSFRNCCINGRRSKSSTVGGLAGVMGILGMVLFALLMPNLAPEILTFLQ